MGRTVDLDDILDAAAVAPIIGWPMPQRVDLPTAIRRLPGPGAEIGWWPLPVLAAPGRRGLAGQARARAVVMSMWLPCRPVHVRTERERQLTLDSLTRSSGGTPVAPPILNGDEMQYARELREWRERRGMTKKALAVAMAYDPSRVSHIEGGRQVPTEEFTRQAEAALQTGGALGPAGRRSPPARFGLPTRPVERELRTAPFIAWLADTRTPASSRSTRP